MGPLALLQLPEELSLRNIQSSGIMRFGSSSVKEFCSRGTHYQDYDPTLQAKLEELSRELVKAQPRTAVVHNTREVLRVYLE
jgi:hypothetical protein